MGEHRSLCRPQTQVKSLSSKLRSCQLLLANAHLKWTKWKTERSDKLKCKISFWKSKDMASSRLKRKVTIWLAVSAQLKREYRKTGTNADFRAT